MEKSAQTRDMLGHIDYFRDELLWTVRGMYPIQGVLMFLTRAKRECAKDCMTHVYFILRIELKFGQW